MISNSELSELQEIVDTELSSLLSNSKDYVQHDPKFVSYSGYIDYDSKEFGVLIGGTKELVVRLSNLGATVFIDDVTSSSLREEFLSYENEALVTLLLEDHLETDAYIENFCAFILDRLGYKQGLTPVTLDV